MFKDNKDFYPTPYNVIEAMGIDCHNKIVLEPCAGKGDLVKWLKDNGAKQVLVCENSRDLATIVRTKATFIEYDFLKVRPEQISHINMIVANPPFSVGIKHILHMWEIAPDGCEIITLINQDNLDNDYSTERSRLKQLIADYGQNIELGTCFDTAERKTNVEVGLIKLYKPAGEAREFEGFFMEEDETETQGNGIMKFDVIRDVVQRYVASVKCFDEHQAIAEKMNALTGPFDVGSFKFEIGYNNNVTSKGDFKKALQKKAWEYLFNKMNLTKYVTSGVMKDINKFVEDQSKVPFTMRNIYKMFEIIVGTREVRFNDSLVEAIDAFTKHTHENRYCLEGWKTNEGHLLNFKFIVPFMVEAGWSDSANQMRLKSSNHSDKIKDLVKVICAFTGKNYDDIIDLHYQLSDKHKLYIDGKFVESYGERDHDLRELEAKKKDLYDRGVKYTVESQPNLFGKWMDWGFFEIKGFKKGTMHLKFKDIKVWEMLNRKYGAIKGQVLPEKFNVAPDREPAVTVKVKNKASKKMTVQI